MDNWIAKFPKALVVFVVLAGGIFLIIASDPPRTICDAQADKLKEELKSLLSAPETDGVKKTSKYRKLVNHCKATNSPGGCYEYFSQLRLILNAVSKVDKQCFSQIGALGPINSSIWESAELMVRLAWGDKIPTNYYDKMGWMQYADIHLFCELKEKALALYGQRAWQEFQERVMTELPGTDQLPREKAWNLMIISLDCNKFQ